MAVPYSDYGLSIYEIKTVLADVHQRLPAWIVGGEGVGMFDI